MTTTHTSNQELLDALTETLGILADINGSYLTPEMAEKHPTSWGETRRRSVAAQAKAFAVVAKVNPARYGLDK